MTINADRSNVTPGGNFFSNIKIGTKLSWGFGILIALTLVLGVGTFITTRAKDEALEELLKAEEKILFAEQMQVELLQARLHEQEFLMIQVEEGFDEAYQRLVVVTQQHTQAVRDLVTRIKLLEEAGVSLDSEEIEILEAIEATTLTYDESFAKVVSDIEKRGSRDTGLEGRFRRDVLALESLPVFVFNRQLRVSLLEIRRHEKNWFLRREIEEVDEVSDFSNILKLQLDDLDLTDAEKNELTARIDNYLTTFNAVVALDRGIAKESAEFRAVAQSILPLAEQIITLEQGKTAEALAAFRQVENVAVVINVGLLIAVVILGAGLAVILTRNITHPITHLATIANRVATGDLSARASLVSTDEIGGLATAFDNMTTQLQETLASLEQRVADRTHDLEISMDVGRRLSTILNESELVAEVVEQVRAAFDYYYAHIYIFDEAKEKLVMAGGTGEAGHTMLARGHSLDRGQGLVGRAAQTNTVVLVPDVSQQEGWLPNPLLPDTKSEVAVPIAIGEEVLGVLDVQHNIAGSLTQAQADLIQNIATQVAIGLQNARAYTRTQHQVEREVLVNTITQKIQGATTVDSAMQIAVRELGRALGKGRTQVRLKATHPENGQVKRGR